MYIGHACACLSLAACPPYCTDPGALFGWADLQTVHGLRC